MVDTPGKGGIKGRSWPPGNQNAFKHGLAAIEKRQDTGLLASPDENIRRQIYSMASSPTKAERIK